MDAVEVANSPVDIERLAYATVRANGNALLINPDNEPGGWVAISQAIEAKHAFAVEVKRGLIALDLDSPELVALGLEAEQFASDSGCSTLLVASGRDGNRHLYIRPPKRSNTPIVKDHLRGVLGIPPTAFRESIRPPLAPHRIGLETRLISPETVEEALAVLGPPETVPPLSRDISDLIRYGDRHGRFNGRSAMALSIANAMRRSGFSLTDFRRTLENPQNLGGAKVHSLIAEGGNVEAFLVRTWDKAKDALTWDPDPVDIVLNRALQAVEGATWSGRSGPTRRALMIALCELGLEHGTTALAFGQRELSLVAQVGNRGTLKRALDALCTDGWITRLPASGTDGHSHTYRVNPQPEPHISRPPLEEVSGSVSVELHPVFRYGSGLGRTPGRVWNRLVTGGPQTVADLATALSIHPNTVRPALKRLDAYGLAKRSGMAWESLGGLADLDRVATLETNAAATESRQRNAMETERRLYAESRDRKSGSRGTAVESKPDEPPF